MLATLAHPPGDEEERPETNQILKFEHGRYTRSALPSSEVSRVTGTQ